MYGRCLRPPVFKQVYSQGMQEYSVSVALPKQLLPHTAKSANFSVTDSTGEEVNVTEAIYMPQSQSIRLKLEPAMFLSSDCRVQLRGDLKYLDGAAANGSLEGVVEQNSDCDMYNISVQRITMYQDGKQITQPEGNKELQIAVRVVNTSNKSQRGNIVVFLNSVETPLATKSVTLEAGEAKEILFDIENGIDREGVIGAVIM